MKKTLKRIVAVTASIALAVGLAACGGKNTSEDGDKIKLTLWMKVSEDAHNSKQKIWEDQFARLKEKFPEVEFEEIVAPNGSDWRAQYDKALMAGEAPDIYTGFGNTDIPTRIENGTIADLTKFVENWDVEKQGLRDKQFDEAITKDGHIYALPIQTTARGLMMNKTLLEATGSDPNKAPDTWDEFVDMAVKAAEVSSGQLGFGLYGTPGCTWAFMPWVWSAGGEMVRQNDDGTWRVAFNEPAAIDAVELMHDLIWKYEVTQKDILMNQNDLRGQVIQGKVAFSWNAYDGLDPAVMEEYGRTFDEFEIIALPTKDASIENPVMSSSSMLTLNPKLSDEEMQKAWEVGTYMFYDEEYLTRTWECMNENGRVDLFVPGMPHLYEKKLAIFDDFPQESKDSLIRHLGKGKTQYNCPHWVEIESDLVEPLQKVFLTKELTRDDIQKIMDDAAEMIYNKYSKDFHK